MKQETDNYMRPRLVILISIFIVFLIACIRIDFGKNKSKKESYKGEIIRIYEDSLHHYMMTFKIKTSTYIFDENAELWSKSWRYARVGDSIIKPADTLILIIKKNDTIQKEFSYKF